MTDRLTPALDARIFLNNLAALRTADAALADRLEATPPPPAAALAIARDGSLTFSWPAPNGSTAWLGRTSLPSARASGLLAGLAPAPGNMLLHGCGSGREIAALLVRLPPTAALFVLDEDPAELSLVLRLHDFHDALADRRLLLFAGPDAWDLLRGFLLDHPGYLPPQRTLNWPWLSADDAHALTTRLTALATEIARHRADALRNLRAAARAQHAPKPRTAVAILALSGQPDHNRLARNLAWGAGQCGHLVSCFLADHPARIHPLALARFLADADAGRVILVNSARRDLADDLPPDAAVVTWLTPECAITPDVVARLGPDDRLIVSSEQQLAAARAAGHPSARTGLALPAARLAEPAGRCAIQLAVDAEDVRPAAVGLHLTTHVALWSTVDELLRAAPEVCGNSAALERLFAQAEKTSGVRIADAAIRQGILDRVRTRLAPMLLARACLDALLDAGFDFDLFGAGWNAEPRCAARCRGPTPPADSAPVAVIHIDPAGRPTDTLLEAVAAGAVPFVYSPPDASASRSAAGAVPRAIAALLPADHVRTFSTPAQLVARLRDFRPDDAASAALRAHIRDHHTWAHRLRPLLEPA